ncbi:MAG TPA: protein phosphatase 2C domain-containing protein [Kofleriaceae bacterium]
MSIAGRRANNEDAVCVRPDLGLFVVADGMGGYEGGEVASSLAVQTIETLVRRTHHDADVTWPYKLDPTRSIVENEVLVATRLANEQIIARRHGELREMGSTVVVLRLEDDQAVIAHVGDSRLYRLRAGIVTQMTIDHSLTAQLEAAGTKPPVDWAWRHVVTRALGTTTGEPEIQRVDLLDEDVYLLCSDGLSEVLSETQLATLMALPVEAACRALVDAAYELGSRDNISAVVVRACRRAP